MPWLICLHIGTLLSFSLYLAGRSAHRGSGCDGGHSRRSGLRRGLRRQLHRVESSDVPRKGATDRPPAKGADETAVSWKTKIFLISVFAVELVDIPGRRYFVGWSEVLARTGISSTTYSS